MLKPEQLTLRELLQDPTFREWFRKMPRLTWIQQQEGARPWWVYAQLEEGGSWKRAAVKTYPEAYARIKQLLPRAHDLAITSRRTSYRPPPGYSWPSSHAWCPFCRRPTVFWHFRKHHALRQFSFLDLGEDRRCAICGHREQDPYVRRAQK